MKAEVQLGREIVERLTEKVTLRLFRVGCEPKNFEILQKLPLTAGEIEKEFDISAMPANRRINELMEAGLVAREKAGQKIKVTPLGQDFLKQISALRNEVINHMAELI